MHALRKPKGVFRPNHRLLCVLGAALLSGCASTSDQDRTKAEGSALGSALGLGVSQAIGWLPGGPTLKRGVHAASTVGGMIAGGEYGEHVASKKAEYASREDYLDACLAHATEVRDRLQAYNRTLAKEITELNAQADELLAVVERQEVDREEKKALQMALSSRLDAANNNLKGVDEEIEIQRGVLTREAEAGSTPYLAWLEERIQELEAYKAELSGQTDRLAALNERASL